MQLLGYQIQKIPEKPPKFSTTPPKQTINPYFNASYRSINYKKMYENKIRALFKDTSPDSVYTTIRVQARSLSSASPLINGYFETMESEIFGDNGFILDVNTDNEILNQKIEELWEDWCFECDQFEVFDFRDIEEFLLKYYLRDGECFIYLNDTPKGLKLQIIPPENVPHDFDDGENIKKGIVFNGQTPIAYYILKDEKTRAYIQVSAKNMIHFKKTSYVTQVRGLSALSSSIFPVLQKEEYISAIIAKEHIGAEFTAVATPENTGQTGFDPSKVYKGIGEEEEKPQEIVKLIESGVINKIDENLKIQTLNPPATTDMVTFLYNSERDIAKSLGLSYATLTGDLRSVNYSSIRQGGTNERRLFKRIQKKIIKKVHNIIFKRWLKHLLIAGKISPKEYSLILPDFSFKAQGWEYIDPSKEATAKQIQLKSGMLTLAEFLRDKGKDPALHLEELKESIPFFQLIAQINQAFNPNQTPTFNQEENQDDTEEQEDD
ncbi:phage portal protein [Helicobacter sp. 12S02232-10]|uniref:phage portal protein n=1 Tax=Helicobacter sp. 12S02232-10 TaxID=1476197 RepID=UPI000BA5DE4C|nr:phage portal protein [Helicobacter sp. 12S02232-10]PAF49222.1 phage portal protein [Helicobacter sp. 12S02232-10]